MNVNPYQPVLAELVDRDGPKRRPLVVPFLLFLLMMMVPMAFCAGVAWYCSFYYELFTGRTMFSATLFCAFFWVCVGVPSVIVLVKR